ncbi:MAG: nuclear transport factor 2 family protein [Proteobacteria bacterium]|nr:nuclear transport factor 2 family protein [Pseudomonadota bacterium]
MQRSKAAMPPPESADEIEARFYEAMQQGDIEKLMAVWSDDEDICCIHPGSPRLVGAAAIRASFEAMFSVRAIDARPEQVRRLQTLDCAVHSVLEHVRVTTSDGPQSAYVVATNVYVKGALGWRLVAHHASPATAREATDGLPAAPLLH